MPIKEREKTGSHKWQNAWCPVCKERTTFWFVSESRMKCSQCEGEKDNTGGLHLDESMFKD
jgi:hypothetical protein